MNDIKIDTLQPQYFLALAQLQYDCFPTVDESEYFRLEHFRSHYAIFPDGSFVALDGERVIGFGSGIFADFDFAHPSHKSHEISGNGTYSTHNPDGAYYYAIDIGVHPDYRGRGIGSQLYEARKALVKQHNKKGIVAGGIIPDYAAHKDHLTVRQYVDKVMAGELYDSTLSFQLRNGFVVRGLLEDYVEDSVSDNWATLIFWQNPDYRKP